MRRLASVPTAAMVVALAAATIVPDRLLAGTTGTVTGRVSDESGAPVMAATVIVVGTRLGAYADAEGKYTILSVPPGTYEVKASRLGFNAVTVTGVIVSADQTTRVDFKMGDTTLRTQEVVVIAARPPVDIGLTSSQANLTTQEIEELPVQNLEDVVNLQAGVVDGHFRGGREGEVQYQVDGVSVNNAFDNSSTLQLDRSLLQEVQVISGTFDAEYGQAMSGVVNAVLKQGGDSLAVDAEIYTGAHVYPEHEAERRTANRVGLGDIVNSQVAVNGPLADNLRFLLSGRFYRFQDYVIARKVFRTTDRANFETNEFPATGSGKEEALGYSEEFSGAAKLAFVGLPQDKLAYQAIFSLGHGRHTDWAFRLDPDGLSTQATKALVHGLDWTHTFSASTFLDASVRQNLFDYRDWVFADAYAAGYDAAGQPVGSANYENGAFVQGVQLNRYIQKTNAFVFKGSIVSQLDQENQAKAGVEFSLPEVTFGSPQQLSYETRDGVQQIVRHEYDPPEFPGTQTNHPLIGAAYIQDQLEREYLTLRAGLRLDYFDARSTTPSDLANPANVIPGAPESLPSKTSAKVAFSPRLGVAYPIEDKAAIHFAYGHFSQVPAIGTVFENSNYDILRNLQAGSASFGVLGNPDVRPEKTVQYEIGYKQILTDDLGFDLTVFYKDIRDLLGVEFINTYTGAQYARLTNVDFGSVFGITLAIDHRRIGPLSLSMDYTLMQALGNSSDPHETATRAEAGEDPRPRLVPFNWDQRHTVNLTAALSRPDHYTVSTVIRVASGQPYTPIIQSGFGYGLEYNSGRKPAGIQVDLRAEKALHLDPASGLSGGLFLRVFNVFDARYFNGAVFSSTGSPDYSRFPETDRVALTDPTRFIPPRRIELGVRLGWK